MTTANEEYVKKFIDSGLDWSETMRLLNSQEQIRAGQIFVAARTLMTRVQINLKLATKDGPQKERFEKWFGPMDTNRHKKVSDNVKKLADWLCAKKVQLHYRGSKADGKPRDDEWENKAKGGKPISNADKGSSGSPLHRAFAWVYPAQPTTPAAHVYLADAFFGVPDHGKYTADQWQKLAPEGKGTDCPAGVLIHELTHSLAGTKDHCYGQEKCIALAKATPDKAIENADNYEYYSEFQWLDLDTGLKEVNNRIVKK